MFSDGSPVLPASFKKAWDRAASDELASEISYHLAPIAGATEVTEGTADEITWHHRRRRGQHPHRRADRTRSGTSRQW